MWGPRALQSPSLHPCPSGARCVSAAPGLGGGRVNSLVVAALGFYTSRSARLLRFACLGFHEPLRAFCSEFLAALRGTRGRAVASALLEADSGVCSGIFYQQIRVREQSATARRVTPAVLRMCSHVRLWLEFIPFKCPARENAERLACPIPDSRALGYLQAFPPTRSGAGASAANSPSPARASAAPGAGRRGRRRAGKERTVPGEAAAAWPPAPAPPRQQRRSGPRGPPQCFVLCSPLGKTVL